MGSLSIRPSHKRPVLCNSIATGLGKERSLCRVFDYTSFGDPVDPGCGTGAKSSVGLYSERNYYAARGGGNMTSGVERLVVTNLLLLRYVGGDHGFPLGAFL